MQLAGKTEESKLDLENLGITTPTSRSLILSLARALSLSLSFFPPSPHPNPESRVDLFLVHCGQIALGNSDHGALKRTVKRVIACEIPLLQALRFAR